MFIGGREPTEEELQVEFRMYDSFVSTSPWEVTARHEVGFHDAAYERHKLRPLELFVYQSLVGTYNKLCRWFLVHHETFFALLNQLFEDGVLWPMQLKIMGQANPLSPSDPLIRRERVYHNFIGKGVPFLTTRRWFLRSFKPFFLGTGNPLYLGHQDPVLPDPCYVPGETEEDREDRERAAQFE